MDVNPAAEESEYVYLPAPVFRAEHGESAITRLVEQQAAKVPSDVFLFLALGSMFASLLFELTGHRRRSRFVGLWPGPLLILGVYNKLVKIFGAR
ncbi:MAG: hypothetical protein IRZ16_22415 [Myxococcaceae bacterium]|nr:hypothetical protein [Myxococcaceae bacterium]